MDGDYSGLFRLDGKVALVTGASKGIGAAMARGLAAFGAQVVVSSRKQAAVDDVARALIDQGYDAAACAANTGVIDDLEQLVGFCRQRYGGIDILVNNAAANPVYGPLQDSDSRAYDKIFDVNLRGPFELGKLVRPIMRERGGGSIMHISSIGGLRPETGIGLYSVSKAALINLTRAMAQDWGADGIRCNAICPGLIKTRFSEALWGDETTRSRFEQKIPLGRLGEPDDLVGLAVYLAADASAYCSGGIYMVDGGYSTI
ncbi:MAG: glucose 1-dehydrogenase [Gammaproteobacteria bacterium]|nr:glucose 1-dehydrogenase [Gammaproteobacteria bacterium]